MDLDWSLGPIIGDPDRLQQVIWNLLSNAVKFTPQSGMVAVGLQPKDGYAQITVSDTGQGISPEFLPYVFDRFRQAESASSRIFGGLGLGLSIVRHLVEMHGGTVQAQSAGLGLGTTFTILLPLVGGEGQRELDNDAPSELDTVLDCPPELRGARVLVVDDRPISSSCCTMCSRHAARWCACATQRRRRWRRCEPGAPMCWCPISPCPATTATG